VPVQFGVRRNRGYAANGAQAMWPGLIRPVRDVLYAKDCLAISAANPARLLLAAAHLLRRSAATTNGCFQQGPLPRPSDQAGWFLALIPRLIARNSVFYNSGYTPKGMIKTSPFLWFFSSMALRSDERLAPRSYMALISDLGFT